MSNTMKCNETSTEDTYDLSSRSTKFDNNTCIYYILLFIALTIFYVVYGNIVHPIKNKSHQTNVTSSTGSSNSVKV